MAAQAIMEIETLWQDILKIQYLIVPCTMESFDKECHMSHLITQFCMQKIDESAEMVKDNKTSNEYFSHPTDRASPHDFPNIKH
jgi:hypothetical protein